MIHSLRIKNMVCDRCKRVVRDELEELGLSVQYVELGEVELTDLLPDSRLDSVRNALKANGFELLDDKQQTLAEQIKVLLINEVQYEANQRHEGETTSAFLARKMGYDYSYLSSLFSTETGQTIEHYLIQLRIEKVKEWLQYNELTVAEIAFRLGYSSSQHLSNQFRQATGQTPGQFRKNQQTRRQALDKVGGDTAAT
jgi:AraC family transcriptional regulator